MESLEFEEIKQHISSIFNNSGVEHSSSEFLKKAAEICLVNEQQKARLLQSEAFCKDILTRLEKTNAELEFRKNVEKQNSVLQAENSDLKTRKQNIETELWQTTQQLNDKMLFITDLQNQIAENNCKCDEYVKEISDLKAQLLQTQNTCKETAQRFETVQRESQNQNNAFQAEKSTLESKVLNLEIELQEKNSQLNKADVVIKDIGIQLANLQSISFKYSNLDIKPDYDKLSSTMKGNLTNMFPNVTTEGLLSSGVQWGNLKQIYGILSDAVINERMDDYEALYKIARKLFDIYNLGLKDPYIIIEPEVGTEYNSQEQHNRGTRIDGIISRVFLFGYKTKNEVKEKAIVEVR